MASTRDVKSLGRTVAGMEDAALAARERPPVEERLAAIHATMAHRRAAGASSSLRRPLAIGVALGAVAAALILWPRAESLHFAVGEDRSPGEIGLWGAAPEEAKTPILFSDGTRVLLQASARARVVSVGEHGARIVVERGTLSADVIPRPDNDWTMIGGPFEIRVTGTSFDATWDPDREVLEVTMREGHVVIRGACLDRERALSRGESATLSCRPLLAPRASGAKASGAASPVASASEGHLALPDIARSGRRTEPEPLPNAVENAPLPPPTWRELARRSEYKQAIVAAEAEGFGMLCETLSAADLLELGTTARLAGRSARASEAYAAIRRRFSGTDPAATAAFHLGQMAFDGARAFPEAHRWFQTYLAERSGGALAAEALGRTMEAEQRMGDLAQARETATRYIASYPNGAHAALARSLLAP